MAGNFNNLSNNQNSKHQSSNLIDNITFSINVENNTDLATNETSQDASQKMSQNSSNKKNVRLIYCGDGVVEECDEDEEEKLRLEREEKQRQIELQKKLDEEAKTMTWLPWSLYMAKKTASKTLEACDFAGEKLAWWFGITKPKFLYEIQEYQRMKKEEEERNSDDIPDELVVGTDGKIKVIQSAKSSIHPTTSSYNSNNYRPIVNFNQNEKVDKLSHQQ